MLDRMKDTKNEGTRMKVILVIFHISLFTPSEKSRLTDGEWNINTSTTDPYTTIDLLTTSGLINGSKQITEGTPCITCITE